MRIRTTFYAVSLALATLSAQAVTTPQDRDYPMQPGDPLVTQQWYLKNTGQDAFSARGGKPGIDLDLDYTHLTGVRGKGVTVAVIDDGLDIRHPDLIANVLPGSKNFIVGAPDANDPTPGPNNAGDSHGTGVGGIIAAVGYNQIGGRGIAPSANLQGFNWLKAQTNEGWIYSHGIRGDKLDRLVNGPTEPRIFNQSYGWTPFFSYPGNPDLDTDLAMNDAVYESVTRFSHGGKGASFVKSAGNAYNYFSYNRGYMLSMAGTGGNFGLPMDEPNIEPTNSNYWNIVVSALNADGVRSSYSSASAAVLLTTPGGEYGDDSPAMVTTDLGGCARGYNTSPASAGDNRLHGGTELDPNCDFNGTMNGTSSAAPSLSGTIALVMSANPNLSARDVRHILIHSARKVHADHAGVTLKFKDKNGGDHQYLALPGWQKNAAGLSFNNWYGFGLPDADKAVAMAKTYATPLNPLQITPWQKASVPAAGVSIPDGNEKGVDSAFVQNDGLTIEGVQVRVDIGHTRMRDLAIELISPAGTRSVIVSPRAGLVADLVDPKNPGFHDQRLLSTQFYGESAKGKWTLRVIDTNGDKEGFRHWVNGKVTAYNQPNNTVDGVVKSWSIRFIGRK